MSEAAPTPPRGRRSPWVLGACAAPFAVAALMPHPGPDLVLCPWRLATGLPCPWCGATRATVALVHGDPAVALELNPLWPALLALAALLAALAWARPRLGSRMAALLRGRRLLVLGVVLVAVGWAWGLAHRATIAPPV